MLIDVNSPLAGQSIDQDNPGSSYDASYLNRTFGVVEAFKNYPNTLLFFSGNEVINDVATGATVPPYMRVSLYNDPPAPISNISRPSHEILRTTLPSIPQGVFQSGTALQMFVKSLSTPGITFSVLQQAMILIPRGSISSLSTVTLGVVTPHSRHRDTMCLCQISVIQASQSSSLNTAATFPPHEFSPKFLSFTARK
jgi:hypothetical protein